MAERDISGSSPRTYTVTLVRRDEWQATVVAQSKREAMEKARAGEWQDVWPTGSMIDGGYYTVKGAERNA